MSDEDERDDDAQDESTDGGKSSADTDAADEGDDGGSESASTSASDDAPASNPYSDSDDAPAAAEATSTDKKAKKGSALSAGARLAAAKAAKAANKAAKKQARRDEAGAAQAQQAAEDPYEQKTTEEVLQDSPLGRAATRAGEWTQANRQLAMGIAGVAMLAMVGWLGYTWYATSQASAAGALLSDALEIANAEIVTSDDTTSEAEGDQADHRHHAPTFDSIDARNTAALEAYRRVSDQYPSSEAAAWARLGQGRILLAQHEYADARTAYQAAFDHSGDESVVAWQALEGIGASYEAESNWDEARGAYEQLAALSDHAYESVANYHLARMRAASGDEAGALTAFRELVEALREEGDEGEPPFPYTLSQADQRLRELDPSAQGAGPSLHGAGDDGSGGGGGGIGDLTPEQLQELIQRMTKSGGVPAAPPE